MEQLHRAKHGRGGGGTLERLPVAPVATPSVVTGATG